MPPSLSKSPPYQSDKQRISRALERLLGLANIQKRSPLNELAGTALERYALGDRICQVSGDGPSNLYVLVEGQVRLLCRCAAKQRDVTVQRLEGDQIFGADAGVTATALPYHAVAASDTVVLRLLPSAQASLLERYPALRSHLQAVAQRREQLIFFKGMTAAANQPSRHIQQWLPRLQVHHLPPQTPLSHIAQNMSGTWWLRQGVIHREPNNGQSLLRPQVGAHWTDAAAATYRAESAVVLYQLPDTGEIDAPSATVAAPPAAEGERVGSAEPMVLKPQPPPNQSPPPGQSRALATAFPKPIRRQLLDWLHRYPWVEQQSSSDCGAACLAMIAQYWGKRFPLNFLRERAQVGRSGATLQSLAKAAEGLGFHARPVRASLGRMAEQTGPWIAHWQGNHYIVVYRMTQDEVAIADPAMGRQSISRQAFIAHWTGYGLLLDPTNDLYDLNVKQATLGHYFSALVPYRGLALQIIAISIVIQIFGLVTPLFTQVILDQVVVQKSLETLNVFVIGLILFGIWSVIMSAVRQYLLSYFSNRLDLTLISGFIRHTVSLPLPFFESRRVGDIITRVQENQKIQQFLVDRVVLTWLDVVTGFVCLGLMLYYNWQLTLLVLGLVPPIVLLTLGATPILRRISRQVFKAAADQNSGLVEMMTGIATVKSAAAERELRWQWEEQLTQQLNVRFRGERFGIGLQVGNGLINTLGNALLLWYGANLVIHDQLTIGQFVAFNMMIGFVISPILALADLWDELQEVFISVERLNDVFEAQPEETPGQPMLIMPPVEGAVQFDNVTFSYSAEGDRNTLQNLSFNVSAGQTVAIVGRSGSGKSTLVKLLEGLYQPNKGRISIDGHDIRHVSPASLRSQLGVVPQECFLFSGTILENILLHRSAFSLEDAVGAAKLAEAHGFIQTLPLGYNTPVGERGAALSGGQRQRIAIARALLSEPRILVLDEATSSLDTEAERRFQANLTRISRDRTIFVIAHRLSTVRQVDQILVLDQGILVEQGSHSDLMASQGLYCHLVQQQLSL